eukprot:SAG31_NODE_998_length_10460_cov_255.143505_3_plen_100_part_00
MIVAHFYGAQRGHNVNIALPLVNCLKLVRGFVVWFIGPVVSEECGCGSYGVWRSVALALLLLWHNGARLPAVYVHVLNLVDLLLIKFSGPEAYRTTIRY